MKCFFMINIRVFASNGKKYEGLIKMKKINTKLKKYDKIKDRVNKLKHKIINRR